MKKLIFVLTLVCCFVLSSVAGTVIFDDGKVHTIYSWPTNCTKINVRNNSQGEPTTVNIEAGANTTLYLRVHETSVLNISGTVQFANASDDSQINITGGSTVGGLQAHDNSQIYISSGSIGGQLQVFDYGKVTIFGGSIQGQINLKDRVTVTIYGSDFMLDGRVVSGTITSLVSTYATLTGTLDDGSPLNNRLWFDSPYASLVILPEPATLLFLGIGILILIKRKRK